MNDISDILFDVGPSPQWEPAGGAPMLSRHVIAVGIQLAHVEVIGHSLLDGQLGQVYLTLAPLCLQCVLLYRHLGQCKVNIRSIQGQYKVNT